MTNPLNILCLALHVIELNKSQSFFFFSLKMLCLFLSILKGASLVAQLVKNWEGNRQKGQGSPSGGNRLPVSRHFFSSRLSRQWHPTPVLLAGKSYGWRSLEGCGPWGRWGSDMTEQLHFHFSLSCIGEGNPLHCSCLENPGDGRAWWAAVYGVAQSRTRLKRLSSNSSSRHYARSVSHFTKLGNKYERVA